MEALIFSVVLVSLGVLAIRVRADSRPAIRPDEHRLALTGTVWNFPSRAPVATDEPLTRHLIWKPPLAAPSGTTSPFPILHAIDIARYPGQPAFATDPHAVLLEQWARYLTNRYWSEHVWLTGRIDQSRLALVGDALERYRHSLQRVDMVAVSASPSRIVSASAVREIA